MAHRSAPPHPRRDSKRKTKKRFRRLRTQRLKAGADKKLKRVFAGIGRPPHEPFKPDQFQIDAVTAIRQSDCLVTAPTGAGKTWIAQEAIAWQLKKGGRSWYASPLKALSNAKYTEFAQFFGIDRVGILTGDRKENPDAPIIVGTTEILRNHLYDAMHSGIDLKTDLVILDEAHFLGDPERGVVWEEIMIYLPPRIPLLLLSATIGNAHQISNWLAGIRNVKCTVVSENKRPVPLYPLFLHPSGMLHPFLSLQANGKKNKVYKKVKNFINTRGWKQIVAPGKLPPFGEMLKVLRKYNLLPAIFFLKSRADCNKALELCLENLQQNRRQQKSCIRRIHDLLSANPHIARHRQRWHLENLAVGSHHSGQLPAWKLVLETLMAEGLLDAVFATSTVAAGVNFPARTVVFFNSDRFNGVEFKPLTPTEFHQMTGRAGRRGMDRIGFCLAVPGRYMDLKLTARLLNSPPSKIFSQIKVNFSMVLNLLLSHTPKQVENLLDRSYAAYLQKHSSKSRSLLSKKKKSRLPGNSLWQDFSRHMNFLKEHGFVTESGELTRDGHWTSQLRVDQPLLIAEGLRKSVLPTDNPALLAAATAAFVSEKELDERVEKGVLSKPLITVVTNLREALTPLAQDLLANGFHARPLYLRPAAAVHAWAMGDSWENTLDIADSEEGIFASLILRTADNLKHIRCLHDTFPETAESAAIAVELILRDPVVQNY
jgi:superfamily II RNA helicase